VLVGGAFLLSTVANIGFQLADIVFTDKDPHRAEGPVESIVSIAVVGGAGRSDQGRPATGRRAARLRRGGARRGRHLRRMHRGRRQRAT